MRTLSLAVALLTAASVATAQDRAAGQFEIRPFVGTNVPLGNQRDVVKDAPMFGAQFAYEYWTNLHFVGSLGWVPAKDRYQVRDNGVDIFQYDAGVEYGLVKPQKEGWELKPFLGAGLGVRTFAFADAALKDRSCAAGYGALGTEFQWGATALRLEARDMVHCYRSPLAGVKSKTRQDLGLSLGVAFHF
ncbi:MAG TPA: hypothetical protein VKA84_04365 [Gemmatimonadaceae bacterium]|nr:hypothetical protein [Gemmatimonadaceae bacterium]